MADYFENKENAFECQSKGLYSPKNGLKFHFKKKTRSLLTYRTKKKVEQAFKVEKKQEREVTLVKFGNCSRTPFSPPPQERVEISGEDDFASSFCVNSLTDSSSEVFLPKTQEMMEQVKEMKQVEEELLSQTTETKDEESKEGALTSNTSNPFSSPSPFSSSPLSSPSSPSSPSPSSSPLTTLEKSFFSNPHTKLHFSLKQDDYFTSSTPSLSTESSIEKVEESEGERSSSVTSERGSGGEGKVLDGKCESCEKKEWEMHLLRRKYLSVEERKTELETLLVNKCEDCEAFKREYERISEEGKLLYTTYLSKCNELKVVGASNAKLQVALEEQSSLLSLLEGKVKEEKEESSSWKKKYKEQLSSFKKNFEEYKKLQSTHNQLQSTHNQLQSTHNQLQSTHNQLQSQYNLLLQQKSASSPSPKAESSKLESMERELKALLKEKEEEKESLNQKLSLSLQIKEEEIKKLEQELATQQSLFQLLQCEQQQLKTQNEQLSSKLSLLKKTQIYNQNTNDNSLEGKESKVGKEELVQRLESLNISNQLLREDNENLQKEIEYENQTVPLPL